MHFFPVPLKQNIFLVKGSLLDVALAFWPLDWLQGAFKNFSSIPVSLLSQTKWFISGAFQSVMHGFAFPPSSPSKLQEWLLWCNVPFASVGIAFPSTDVWSLVSPARGLVLSASLSINSDAFSSICWSLRDLTRTCAVYWWLCWPTYPQHPSDFWVVTVGC